MRHRPRALLRRCPIIWPRNVHLTYRIAFGQIGESARSPVAVEAGVALKGGDADEDYISDEYIAICNSCMHAASAADGFGSRSVGPGHGGGLSLQYDTRVRRNLPGISYPG
jgi:hypothetical protein